MILAKQIGEYLVAAELGRRGLIATTFTGSVPGFDILVSDGRGRTHVVQVKAVRGGNWQFGDSSKFLEITVDDDGRQILGADIPLTALEQSLICIFVTIGGEYGKDQFFIFRWTDLARIISSKYRNNNLAKKGFRPKNPKSLHESVSVKDIEEFRNKWDLFTEAA